MYSPRSLPTSGDMAWGKGENSQFLFLDGKPVTVWLIGESRFWKFREFNAEKRTYIPVGRVVMGVALFHEVDRQAIAAVTAKYSSPPKGQYYTALVSASAYVCHRACPARAGRCLAWMFHGRIWSTS